MGYLYLFSVSLIVTVDEKKPSEVGWSSGQRHDDVVIGGGDYHEDDDMASNTSPLTHHQQQQQRQQHSTPRQHTAASRTAAAGHTHRRLTTDRPYVVSIFIPALETGSPYSITERRVPGLIPVLGSQPAGDVSYKPVGRLPLGPTFRHACCYLLLSVCLD